jgi:hypothetical protein
MKPRSWLVAVALTASVSSAAACGGSGDGKPHHLSGRAVCGGLLSGDAALLRHMAGADAFTEEYPADLEKTVRDLRKAAPEDPAQSPTRVPLCDFSPAGSRLEGKPEGAFQIEFSWSPYSVKELRTLIKLKTYTYYPLGLRSQVANGWAYLYFRCHMPAGANGRTGAVRATLYTRLLRDGNTVPAQKDRLRLLNSVSRQVAAGLGCTDSHLPSNPRL